GGQRYLEFESYLTGLGYNVNSTHINTFVADPSIVDNYNLLIIDRSTTTNLDVINSVDKPILALGYGGSLFMVNEVGFASITYEVPTFVDNSHKILNSHSIFKNLNYIGSPSDVIEPVFYGSAWFGDGREYYSEISNLLPGSIALLDYYFEGTERTTRTVLFAYNVSTTKKIIYWGYDSYYNGYKNCLISLGINLLQNIVEYLKVPVMPKEINFVDINQIPSKPGKNEDVVVNAIISSKINISSVSMYYRINQGSFQSTIMNLVNGTPNLGTYSGIIPGQPLYTNITYYIYAEDIQNNSKKAGPFNYTVSDNDPPEVINSSRYPINPGPLDDVKINISISDLSGVKKAQLFYQINGSGGFNAVNMTLYSGTIYNGIWNGTIPAQVNGTKISYYFNISDNFDNFVVHPSIYYYGYCVGQDDINAPIVNFTTIYPSNPSYQNVVMIRTSVNITAEVSGIKNVTMCYRVNKGNALYKNMIFIGVFTYNGDTFLNYSTFLSNFNYGDLIEFNITSYDICGNSYTTPIYNFSIIDTVSPEIVNISHTPDRPTNLQNVQITLNLKENNSGSGIRNATIYYNVTEYAFINLESPHLVPNFYDNTWDIIAPNCYKMELIFSNITLEENYDYLYIYNYSYGILNQITGKYTNLNITVFGNTSRIRLITDFDIKSWGFSLIFIKFYYNVRSVSASLTSGNIYDGQWTATIPAQNNVSIVAYWCRVFDFANNSAETLSYYYISGDNEPPTIINTSQSPSGEYIDSTDSPSITAYISDNYGIAQSNVYLQYTLGATWTNISMILDSNDLYTKNGEWIASIPTFPDGTKVIYRIMALDIANNTIYSQNFTYYCDGKSPEIVSAEILPIDPNPSENVCIRSRITDYSSDKVGSGTKSVLIFYFYSVNYLIESPHPYHNNQTLNWTFSFPNALGFRIHFRMILLNYGDIIRIIDGKGYVSQTILFSTGEFWTNNIMGNNFTIQLDSDGIGTAFGFVVDQIIIYENTSCQLINGTVNDGIWEGIIPNQPFNTTVSVEIIVQDSVGNIDDQYIGNYTVKDNVSPQILQFNLSNEHPTPDETVNITLHILEDDSGIKNITLYISMDGGLSWYNISFENMSNGIWRVYIPKQPDNTIVEYYIVIYDKCGNSNRYPEYEYLSITFNSPSEPTIIDPFMLSLILLGVTAIITVFMSYFYFKSTKEIKSKIKLSSKYKKGYKGS
ncbi:MAG: CUB domain-containing protein, partial [Candidatus Helarchaeota archaeon]